MEEEEEVEEEESAALHVDASRHPCCLPDCLSQGEHTGAGDVEGRGRERERHIESVREGRGLP